MKQNALLGLAAAFREPDPSMYYTEETRLPKALAYAVTAVGMWVRKGEIYIPYLDEAVMDTFQHLRTVHQYVGYDEKDAQVVGYQASDITLEEWRQMFLRSPRAAQQIRRRLAENVRLGFPMPPAAGEFAAELADGLQDPKRKSKKKTLTHRDTLLAGIAKKVSAA